MHSQKMPFTQINLNKTEANQAPITIHPRQVIFQDVQSNNCYQIDLYIRNESIEVQKIRIINPRTKHYKIKTQEGSIKNLAQGLAYKISVYFCCQKNEAEDNFADAIFIYGNNFKQKVLLKALSPRGNLLFPLTNNFSRLLVGSQNIRKITVKNNGKAAICIQPHCQSALITLTKKYLNLEPDGQEDIELKLKSKKAGPLQQKLKISNDLQCQITGVFVQQFVQFLGQDGQRLTVIDLGQVFIGQSVQQKIYVANNTDKTVQMLCKTISKNSQMSDIKVDFQRGTFVIKSAPEEYAKDLKNCYSSLTSSKQTIKPFSQFENTLIIYKTPTLKEVKRFHCYAMGLLSQQIEEESVLETLVIQASVCKSITKIPIKFISVFPRLKISQTVLQFGQIKERSDTTKTFTLINDGQKDIFLTIEQPQNVKIQGQRVVRGRHSEVFNVHLHTVRIGKIAKVIVLKLFEGLAIEVKVFATCRSSSIRAKKINNLHSNRQLTSGFYYTLNSTKGDQSERNFLNLTSKNNKTDYLQDKRTARINKLLKQHIQTQKDPLPKEPKLNISHSLSSISLLRQSKNINVKKITKEQKLKLTYKDLVKYNKSLTVDQLQNIVISEIEIDFGTIFIDNLVTKTIAITNKNLQPIIFQFDVYNNQALFETNSEIRKVQGFSESIFQINFRPNNLGAVSMPLGYVINRHHAFQMSLTAYITLVNIEISTKIIDLSFGNDDSDFQKSQVVQLTNVSATAVAYMVKFQEGKHFYVDNEREQLQPHSKSIFKVFYRPVEGDESGLQRMDSDKMMIKVLGGAENLLKCKGTVNDAKITVKENEISCQGHIIALPYIGKLNLKNHSKTESIYKFQIPNDLADILIFDKQINVLSGEQKRQISYTLISLAPKKISSYIILHVRGGKSIKLQVDCSFIFPQIKVSKDKLDFGHIPIMGNNYLQTLTLKNLHKNQIKLQVCKRSDCEEYLVQIRQLQRSRVDEQMTQAEPRMKKRGTTKQEFKEKKNQVTQKTIRLLPNIQTILQVKFTPKKIQNFDVSIPLKLFGTALQIYPLSVRLLCSSIEPVVYLHPQKVQFDKKIIGEGKNSFAKFFQIKNPHDYDINWVIEPIEQQKTTCFYISQTNGNLAPHETVKVQVIFKPQQQGYFAEKYNVILHYKKTSHISLSFQGSSVFPCLKFRTNEILMPPVPLKIQSRAFVVLQNHGYQVINISKWKTSSHFQMVDIYVNFVEGKLLSLAKKCIKVQVVCSAQTPISFTTFLQFYDQFGVKYEIPLSCTFENSLMTNYSYVQYLSSKEIIYNKKENQVKVAADSTTSQQISNSSSQNESLISCQFIKNWLNYQLNLGIKCFPDCFIQSQGELFIKTVNKMSGLDLVKKFQYSSPQTVALNLYSYYSDCIRTLKLEGAFLNQIRPQYLLSYKQYRTYISCKNMIPQSQQTFKSLLVRSWTALFYQLIKLFFMNTITQKMVAKFTSSTSINSTIYSSQEMLIFRFLNSFLNDQFIFSFTDRTKIFQIIQKCLQKTFNINFTSVLKSLKISPSMPNSQLIVAMAKILHQKLKQYGLSFFLSLCDLYTIGAKQMAVYLTSFILMIYHFSCSTPICFDASIGDKVTKIIDIENPSNRKIKYKVKLQGSQQFQVEQNELILPNKGKSQLRAIYLCKQKKQEEAKLILVPIKQDNMSGLIVPLVFKFTTSIISKITLKKIQITANLYEITTVSLQAQLPIDITQLSQFNVTINDTDQQMPSFYCFQSLTRALKSNKDKLDIKLVPLSTGYKFCKVCYRSSVYGEFNFQIMAKIQPPSLVKQIKLKQLKVNKQQIVSIDIAMQNQQLVNALSFLSDHHCKMAQLTSKRTITPNKYSVGIVQSSYISICEESLQISKLQLQGKDCIHVNLKCIFGRPFLEYSCTLMIKNQALMDIRYYKLVTSVAMKPKIVPVTIKCKARQSITHKIAIKNAPCDLTVQNIPKEVSIQNFTQNLKQNIDLIVTFSPEWVSQKDLSIISQNHQTLEQVIYQICFIAEQPSFFDKIKLMGSSVFEKKSKIFINLTINEEFKVITNSSRIKIQGENKIYPSKKYLVVTILAGQEEKTSIKLIKQQTGLFYWTQVQILNQKVEVFKTITLEESPNGCKSFLLQNLQITNDYQLRYQQHPNLKCNIVNQQKGSKWLCFEFRPIKQIQFIKKIYLLNKQREYSIDLHCKAPPIPTISLPEIISHNRNVKTTAINIINSSEFKGNYRATIEPAGIFGIDCYQFELKGKQKKQIRIVFTPQSLQTKYKGSLIFQSDVLPTYQYSFTAVSEFSKFEKTVECQYYSDRDTLKDIYFTNPFSQTQEFKIETHFKNSPFQLLEPNSKKFILEAGSSKKFIVKASCSSKKENGNGKLVIIMQNKLWEYNLVSLQIKHFSTKKITWNCIARQIYYDIIDFPQNIIVKSIQSPPEIAPYLNFATLQGTNSIKLKYYPLKPLAKQQYQVLLITDSIKYVVNCLISVAVADFDDTIFIKTKQINEVGCVAFKLTNTKKISAPFRAYFLKGQTDFTVEVEKNILEPYGRIGTGIILKFTSHVFNKKVQDQLWVQTSEMLWRFKVKGMLSKVISNK